MTTQPAAPAPTPANERLKDGFRAWLWSSMIVATLLHFGVFALWPELTAAETGVASEEMEVIDLPAPIDIPPPPPALTRPAFPVPGPTDIDEDITIGRTSIADNPPEVLPPPPESTETTTVSERGWNPYTVGPSILNTGEIVRAMERAYPPLLRDAGIGGTVHVRFHIDEEGVVQDFRLDGSSGHRGLDEAALSLAELYRFSPALNRDRRVAVWVSFPITFRVRDER